MGIKKFTERIKRMFFKENVRFLRNSKGWTQEELANALDFAKPNISKYESGMIELGLETVIKLARFFGISIDDLLLKKMEPEKPFCLINLPYLLSVKLDTPVPCRLDAPVSGFTCRASADCLHQHLQVI